MTADTLKRLFVLMGLAVLPAARSEREMQLEKGKDAMSETGLGFFDLAGFHMCTGTMIAIIMLLIDVACRRRL